MMTHYSLKPVRLSLRPSLPLAVLLGAVTLGATAVVVWMPIPAWLALAVCLVIVPTAFHAIRRDALLRPPAAITVLEVTSSGELRCQVGTGDWLSARILDSSTVMPWLTVLNLKLPGRFLACHVLVTPDRVDAEEFRRLRVWLKWGSREAENDPG